MAQEKQKQKEPESYPNCRFYVQVDSITAAVFTEVGGIQVETAFFDYEEGGNNGFVHRLPGRTKASNLTLKRGMSKSNDFFKWHADITRGKIDRRNVSIIMFDAGGNELMRWNLLRAYPVKWVGPQFNATGGQMVIETLELAHEGLDVG
ncbi:MAG: phage tail protein [Thermomicrobiales bacterium]